MVNEMLWMEGTDSVSIQGVAARTEGSSPTSMSPSRC